jgi:hypothetical protein
MVRSLRGVLAAFGVYDILRTRRQPLVLRPPLERRQPEIAAENYAARHLLEHTLDRKADLRRLAPSLPEAARRYRELLGYELEALQDVNRAMRATIGGRDLAEFLRDTGQEIDRLQIEIAWCEEVLGHHAAAPASQLL